MLDEEGADGDRMLSPQITGALLVDFSTGLCLGGTERGHSGRRRC